MPRLCQSIPWTFALITAVGALTQCSSNGTYLAKPMNMSDLRSINPCGYLHALSPHDREDAAMELGRGEMQGRKIEQNKLRR